MIESVNLHPTPKVPQRQLLPLILLGMLLVALLLLGQWFWLTRTFSVPEPQIVLPSERIPLVASLLRQKAIVVSLAASAFTMLLALLAAVSPLTWWARLLSLFGKAPAGQYMSAVLRGQEPQTAEEWVAAQAAFLGVPPTVLATEALATPQPGQAPGVPPAQGQPSSGQPPAGQQPGAPPAPGQPGTLPAPAQQPGAPGQPPQPGAPPAPGQPGTLPAGQQPPAQQPGTPGQPPQPGAPPAPGQQPLPADQQQPPAQQPGAPQPPGQPAPAAPPPQPGLQQLLATEEKMDIKELTDIGDILSSFKESDDIPAQLLALSQSLNEVDLDALVAHSRRVVTRLTAANSVAQQQIRKKGERKALV